MTFDAREISLADGQPIRLYLFERGQDRWAYCTADRDIEHAGVLYVSTSITDNGTRQTGDIEADAFEIIGPHDLSVAQLYRGMIVSREITLTVRDVHYQDEEPLVSWVGRIHGVEWTAEDRCKITCQSMQAAMAQPGLRLSWSRNCPYALYGRGCGVDKTQFEVPGTIADLNGLSIEVAALNGFADDYFTGGFIEWPVGDAEVERRTIESHTGTTAVMFGGTAGLVQGQAVTAYPGCPRTIDVCDSRFNNAENYGGVPHLPGRSPFDGNPIF